MTVVVTGAFGNVGRSAVRALLEQGDAVSCFELPTKRNKKLASRPERLFGLKPGQEGMLGWQNRLRYYWGDIRKSAEVEKALAGADAVCHLAALIPPLADANPSLAFDVNVNGTRSLLAAIEASGQKPLLIFASSVAVYGDRLADPQIKVGDKLAPTPGDPYGAQKVICERSIQAASVPWIILRLSYIVWRKKLDMDAIMFRMPLETRVEVCHTEDAGRAFAHATRLRETAGAVYNIGGGEACRTTYREYLDRMFSSFGLGGIRGLPDRAFATTGYHCGYMDSARSDSALSFQRRTIEDYYREVRSEAAGLRFLARPFAWAILRSLRRSSPYTAWCGYRPTRKEGAVRRGAAQTA